MYENNLVNWNALRPRGPSLFRSAGKGSKRGRFARHFGSGGRGGYSPTRVSLASFSLHRAKRMKSRQRNLHHNYKIKVIRLTSPDAVRESDC